MWRKLFGSLFGKGIENRALADLCRDRRYFDPQMEAIVAALPRLADLMTQAWPHLYNTVIRAAIDDYDTRAQSAIAHQIDPTRERALRNEFGALLLFAFHQECARLYPDRPEWAMGLTRALHFAMGSPNLEAGARAYLSYRNPHFEAPEVAYAFRFGQRVGQIMETLDTPFSLRMAQQATVGADAARRLTRWVFFDEPIAPETERETASEAAPVPTPSGTLHTTGADAK